MSGFRARLLTPQEHHAEAWRAPLRFLGRLVIWMLPTFLAAFLATLLESPGLFLAVGLAIVLALILLPIQLLRSFALWQRTGVRGRIEVIGTELRFVRGDAELPWRRVPLAEIHRLHRYGRTIHVALRDEPDWYLWCRPLQAEDLFDHLIDSLEQAGLEVRSSERSGA